MINSVEKKRLVHAILTFLANEKEADADGLSVASQVISEVYGIDLNDSSLALPNQYSLLDVFNAGLNALKMEQQQQQQQQQPQQQQQSLENNPKYQAFIKQLEDMGYFNNCNEEQRKLRLEKAKEKFLLRAQSSSTLSTSSDAASGNIRIDKELAEKHKNEGNEYLKKKMYKEALESYKNAIKADPTNAIYPANMAATYLQTGDFDNAEQCCKKAIELDPKYSKAYSRLAVIYQRKGKTQEAIAQLELAKKYDPNNEEYANKINELRSSLNTRPTNPFASMMGGGVGGGNPLANLASMMGGSSGGMPDLGSLGQMFSNPEFMRMATEMMQRPEMQQMVQNMMQSFVPDATGGESPFDVDAAGIERVLQEPEVQNNPKLKKIFEECREKGIKHALSYIGDPEVANFMRDFAMRQLSNLPPDQNPLAGLMNMMSGRGSNMGSNVEERREDDDNNMYS